MAELTETGEEATDSTSRMEVDAGLDFEKEINYQDQRYGMLLTSSSKAAPEYLRFKAGMVDVS